MAYSKITFSVQENIAFLCMNSPDDLNALSAQMGADIRAALEQCEIDGDIRAVVLHGAGRAFSAGGDIHYMKDMLDKQAYDEMAYGTRRLSGCVRMIRRIKKPVIAAVHGAAAGGACNMALLCDFRVMAEGAKLLSPYMGIALVPDLGGVYAASAYLGLGRMSDFLYLGEPILAARALELGIAHAVVPKEQLLENARALAQRLMRLPREAFAKTKGMVNAACLPRLDAVLEMEEDIQWDMVRGDDCREGVDAFLAKRPPTFK